jgi:hypothetical protein
MGRSAAWLTRIGALLILLSPLLPQAECAGERVGVLWVRQGLAAAKATRTERLAVDVGLLLPSVIALGLLAASVKRVGASLRGLSLAALLVLSFVLATLGSLLLTDPSGSARPVAPSFALSLALFVAPLLLSGVALARGLERGLDAAPGLLEPLSFAVLLGLQGLFLADAGWALLVGLTGVAAPVRLLPGAAVEPLGAVLLAAGALLASPRPLTAVDSAPASV